MTLSAEEQRMVPDIRVAVMRLARRLRNERAEDGPTPSQLAVMGTLFREGPRTLRELAEIERVQPPSMTRIIAALEAGGWVTKRGDSDDKRQVIVTVTPRAEEWVAQERARRDRWLSQRLERLTPQDREQLLAAVPILNALAQAD